MACSVNCMWRFHWCEMKTPKAMSKFYLRLPFPHLKLNDFLLWFYQRARKADKIVSFLCEICLDSCHPVLKSNTFAFLFCVEATSGRRPAPFIKCSWKINISNRKSSEEAGLRLRCSNCQPLLLQHSTAVRTMARAPWSTSLLERLPGWVTVKSLHEGGGKGPKLSSCLSLVTPRCPPLPHDTFSIQSSILIGSLHTRTK